jgi:Kef-type K+ transport system membrane component KefB
MVLAGSMQIPILTDIVVILGLSIAVILLFRKLGIPSIIGYLITGIIAGPYASFYCYLLLVLNSLLRVYRQSKNRFF